MKMNNCYKIINFTFEEREFTNATQAIKSKYTEVEREIDSTWRYQFVLEVDMIRFIDGEDTQTSNYFFRSKALIINPNLDDIANEISNKMECFMEKEKDWGVVQIKTLILKKCRIPQLSKKSSNEDEEID